MKFLHHSIISLLSTGIALTSAVDTEHCLLCRVTLVDVQFQNRDESIEEPQYLCETDPSENPEGRSEQAFRIDFPLGFVPEHEERLNSGLSRICIPGGYTNAAAAAVEYPQSTSADSIFFVDEFEERKLQSKVPRSGNRRTLVVNVNGNQDLNDRFAGSFFSLGPQRDSYTNSLRTQYQRCSAEQLNFDAATGNGVVNGVLQLNLGSQPVNGVDIFVLRNIMNTAVQNALGVSNLAQYDHVAYCMPPGATYGNGGSTTWLAFAYVNGAQSYYNAGWCDSLSALMHEIGHNLGLHHSSHNGQEYGDQSGMMGYSYGTENGPLMCFNGYKHWQLGWFDDETIDINTSNGPHTIALAAFTDVRLALTPVLLRLGRVFLQYNAAKSYNTGTQEFGNQVTFTLGTGNSRSTNIGSVSNVGTSGSISSGNIGSGVNHNVHLCSKTDIGGVSYAVVSVHTDAQQPDCSVDILPTPTSTPTRTPTKLPTANPTATPTKLPTPTPTKLPTATPTKLPTATPTKLPTATPTKLPTATPTKLPTATPTKLPTATPTKLPTATPTKLPTATPTKLPTASPVVGVTPSPTKLPTATPTKLPTATPTKLPTVTPTKLPTATPTKLPTASPVVDVTPSPTKLPTATPTKLPTASPVVGVTPSPTPTPTKLPTGSPISIDLDPRDEEEPEVCEDTEGARFVWRRRRYTCGWLRFNINARRTRICDQTQDARELCPEACGLCNDECSDNRRARFRLGFRRGRTCRWVARFTSRINEWCVEGNPAWTNCPETCNAC